MLAALNLRIFIVECGCEDNHDEDDTRVELQIRNSLNWSVLLKILIALLKGDNVELQGWLVYLGGIVWSSLLGEQH